MDIPALVNLFRAGYEADAHKDTYALERNSGMSWLDAIHNYEPVDQAVVDALWPSQSGGEIPDGVTVRLDAWTEYERKGRATSANFGVETNASERSYVLLMELRVKPYTEIAGELEELDAQIASEVKQAELAKLDGQIKEAEQQVARLAARRKELAG